MNADEDGFLPANMEIVDDEMEMETEDDEIEVDMGHEEMDMHSDDQAASESMVHSEIAKLAPIYQESVKKALERLHELGFPAARAFPALQQCKWSVADAALRLTDMHAPAQERPLPAIAGSRSPMMTIGVAKSASQEKSAKSPFHHRRDLPLSPPSSKNVPAAVVGSRATAARATSEDEEDIGMQVAILNSLASHTRSQSLPRDPRNLSSQGLHSPSSGGAATTTSSAAPPTRRSLRQGQEEPCRQYNLADSEEED